jgi:hypothetical protein
LASRGLSSAGVRHPWVKPARNAAAARPLPSFRLLAILATWMEGDIIRATVQNALAQGCDRVFLIDNESPDDTVAEARAAGAELVRSFSTDRYEEDTRLRLMNDAAAAISAGDAASHIWWLWIDGDEFPHGPRGLTLREFLGTLDASFRVVGSRYFDHYPDGPAANVPGRHPLDFQPLATERVSGVCWSWHYKHPLQRFDRDAPPIRSERGFHLATCDERPLLEPAESVLTHHFPWRERAITTRRLELLCAPASGPRRADPELDVGVRPMVTRFRNLGAVYEGDWPAVGALKSHYVRPRKAPVTWTTLVRQEDAAVRRWYEPLPPGEEPELEPRPGREPVER